MTSRDTNVWMRDRSWCANSEVQHSVDYAEGGLGAEGGWQSIDVCQKSNAIEESTYQETCYPFGV